ncbi:uncharacterized protein BDW43DRAFT_296037 [Aspergillus alliaceus]|uniref:uncharacterized protein n=1 Tax=Petromyces alliaceus TaxID=209559 RepID=UPI0012A4D510|nr:Alpha/Beta hydrolase protein [Aspergillus alliaceus]KAB8239662.1 Alpha/Beta hydrolase protein [Aspergillus alliaceus]
MTLPIPTYAFTVPSLHDGTPLDCRLYLPRVSLEPGTIRGAIVAHPYATLGGCYDDPVVSFVGGELLKSGYIVGTFNFRGAGNSEGRTSWTAKPELADYVSFYGFMLCYLHCLELRVASLQGDNSSPEEGADNRVSRAQPTPRRANIHLILGGYSYGSLIASHLPTLDVVANLFKNMKAAPPSYEIVQTAGKVSGFFEASGSTPERPLVARDYRAMVERLDITRASISYLLVSPLLPPLNLFLTFFSTMSLDISIHIPSQREQIPCPKPTHQLCTHPSLAIYGNQDTFTSASKLNKWSDELSHAPRSQFRSAEIDGAGHFWREDGVESQARDALRNWLRLIP